ncbi:MAG: hypothetical protein NZ523_08585 [Elioraea sp.]|nr:hypothetical protein [Elioraea sp.]MDW8443220.1 hypothetical protein [Acetobacteraceae bacterium]
MVLLSWTVAIKATLFGIVLGAAAMSLCGERCLARCAERMRGAGR